MTFRLLRHVARREEGSSLAAVLMVMMVVSVLGIAAVQTAQHSNDVSSVDRERLQAISAADAGVNDAIRRISSGAGCDSSASAPVTSSDTTGSVGKWQTRIDPEVGTTCGQTLNRVVRSWGFGATGGTRSMRQLEVTVALVPQAGFPYTLFADGPSGTITVKNNGSITGDAYAAVLDQTKNNLAANNIITTGSIVTKNNAAYNGMLWAAGDVTLGNNSVVGGSVIAAGTASGTQGTITLNNNASIGGDAISKGAYSGSTSQVHGTITQNNPGTPNPPILHKPVFTWNPANYTPAPTTGTAAQITTALNTAQNNLQGTFYSTDSSGTITVPSSATVTGPLTIVSSGKISADATFSNSAGPWQVVMVALSTASDAIDGDFTGSSGLDVLWFTLGGAGGKNGTSFKGSVYADSIAFKNNFNITKSTSLQTNPPVGFTFDSSSTTTFLGVQRTWREIVPGTPPS